MTNKKIFKAIRKADVILWNGEMAWGFAVRNNFRADAHVDMANITGDCTLEQFRDFVRSIRCRGGYEFPIIPSVN